MYMYIYIYIFKQQQYAPYGKRNVLEKFGYGKQGFETVKGYQLHITY